MSQASPVLEAGRRHLVLPDGEPARVVVGSDGHETVLVGREADRYAPALGVDAPWPVYVPSTRQHPATAAGLPDNATWVDVSSSPVAYFAAFGEWWARGETFMVIEHDVVCRTDVVAELDACPEPWCVFPYDDFCHVECREAWRNLLGCTRFRSELMEAVPDAVSAIPAEGWDWHNLCDGIGDNLRAAGFTHHWHFPEVHHHHMRDECS